MLKCSSQPSAALIPPGGEDDPSGETRGTVTPAQCRPAAPRSSASAARAPGLAGGGLRLSRVGAGGAEHRLGYVSLQTTRATSTHEKSGRRRPPRSAAGQSDLGILPLPLCWAAYILKVTQGLNQRLKLQPS